MKLLSLLIEGLSPIVYHWTSINALRGILTTNAKTLDVAFGTPSDMLHNGGKLYFLSTSRIKWGGYSRSSFSPTGRRAAVIMVLDGNKLNQSYKGRSADYWGPQYRKAAFDTGSTDTFLGNDENEDRLITNKSVITNFKRFIIEIHIFIPAKVEEYDIKAIKDVNGLFSPIYYYSDASAFKTLNKAKAAKVLPLKGKSPTLEPGYVEREATLESTASLIELYNSKDLSNLSRGASDMMWALLRSPDYNIQEYTRSVQNEVHNYKGSHVNRSKVEALGAVMRKAHATNVSSLVTMVADKVQRLKGK